MSLLRFVVIGLSGYALDHIKAVTWLEEQGLAKLAGVVALKNNRKDQPELIEKLKSAGVRLYSNIDEFLTQYANEADILTVPIGIHQHVPISITAMEAGLHVYCEKPIAATIQEVDQLINTERKTNRKVVIGFQHIYSNSIRLLKARICDGRLGKVQSISVVHCWSRSEQYYSRNEWAGRLRLNQKWVLDSPANNAMAHYLFNMLFLSSQELNKVANPIKVKAELYRANRIESADITQLEFITHDGADGFVTFMHSCEQEIGPFMQIVCEKGIVDWETDEGKTTISHNNGSNESFDNSTDSHWRYFGFKDLVQSIQKDTLPACTPSLARSHTLTINAMHESCPEIVTIPDEFIGKTEKQESYPPNNTTKFRHVKDLDESVHLAFEKDQFFSELNVDWAKRVNSKSFKINDYEFFPQATRIN